MNSPKLIRRGGLAAVVGGILRILYLFYALAYFATEDGALSLEALPLFGIGFSLFGVGALWAKVGDGCFLDQHPRLAGRPTSGRRSPAW
jgi:hypothetical protein